MLMMLLLICDFIKILKSVLNHDAYDAFAHLDFIKILKSVLNHHAYDAFANLYFIEILKKCFKS